MRRANRSLRRVSPWVATVIVLGACGAQSLNSVTPDGESRSITASVPLETANSGGGDRASLIFQGDVGASVEDAALVLALFNLPEGTRNANNLIGGAGSLLQTDTNPIAAELNPLPNAENANFVRPDGVQLTDVAAIVVASQVDLTGENRAATLADAIDLLLGTDLSGTGPDSDILSIPGSAPAPTPTPSGTPTPAGTPNPDPTPDPDELAQVLNGQNCVECELRNTSQLAGVDLSNRDLSGSELRGSDLEGTILTGARLVGTRLDSTNLDAASLQGANLSGANLRTATLRDTNFSGATLEAASLSSTTALRANLSTVVAPNSIAVDARLNEADLSNGNFQSANFNGAQFDSANVAGANFTDATFLNSRLTNVLNLGGATLQGAKYNASTQFPADFGQARRDAAGMVLEVEVPDEP
ncbi:MAG: pentapeptide repeat-containing protein [Cyanobacteria bacterium J06639_1]